MEIEESKPLEVGPFKDMTKSEQVSHLKDFHFNGAWLMSYAPSTYNKADLERVHDELHSNHTAWSQRHKDAWVSHAHVNIDASQLTSTVLQQMEALGIDKPLTAQQKKNLLDLLNNDFATLSAELDVYADNTLAQRKEEARTRGEAKAPILNKYQDAARQLRDDYDRAIRDIQTRYDLRAQELLDEAEKEGIVSSYGTNYQTRERVKSFSIKGLADEYKEIEKETRNEIAVARNALNREKLVATRKIMLAAIPKDSAQLIDRIPSASDLMKDAMAARQAAKTIEAAAS